VFRNKIGFLRNFMSWHHGKPFDIHMLRTRVPASGQKTRHLVMMWPCVELMNYSWCDSDFIANDTKASNWLVSYNLTTTSILNLNQRWKRRSEYSKRQNIWFPKFNLFQALKKDGYRHFASVKQSGLVFKADSHEFCFQISKCKNANADFKQI
jgi:hypothetical protein